jgi:hypothetical protein
LISSFVQDVITDSQKKSGKLRAVVSSHQELAALEKRVDDEKTKNLYLEEQKKVLEAQKNAHQEQLKE